jgi:hypothetical protein
MARRGDQAGERRRVFMKATAHAWLSAGGSCARLLMACCAACMPRASMPRHCVCASASLSAAASASEPGVGRKLPAAHAAVQGSLSPEDSLAARPGQEGSR